MRADDLTTCSAKGCNNEPAVRTFWPGESPPPEFCIACAAHAAGIAKAMGFTLHQEPIAQAYRKEAERNPE